MSKRKKDVRSAPPRPEPRPAGGRRRARWLAGSALLAALALAVGLVVLRHSSTQAHARATGPDTWIWHYTVGDESVGAGIYRRLLEVMPPDVRACVVAETEQVEDARRALKRAVADASRVDLVTVNDPLSGWARDRYVFFEKDGRPHVLVAPRELVHPEAHGDLLVPQALKALHPGLVIVEADFLIEGGDLIVLKDRVLVGATSVLLNVHRLDARADPFLERVAEVFGRPVTVVGRSLGEAPYQHIDMFLTPLDERTILLGDPRLALDAFRDAHGTESSRLHFGDAGLFLRQRQLDLVRRYDAVAAELEADGFRVHRVPIAHGEPTAQNTWGAVLTWNNVLLHDSDGRRIAFVPRYNVAPLDGRAREIWEAWGFEVVSVPVRSALGMGGALRCLTNVLPGYGDEPEDGRGHSPL